MSETVNIEHVNLDLMYAITDWVDRVFSRLDEENENKELRACSKRISDMLSIHMYDLPREDLVYIMPALVVFADQNPDIAEQVKELYTKIAAAMES